MGRAEEREATMLELLRRTGAVREGHFTLASGKKAQTYVDGKQVTLNSLSAATAAKLVLEILREQGINHIGGVATGGIPMAAQAAVLGGVDAFYVRTQVKDHGLQRELEGVLPPDDEAAAIIEDVTTTGTSLLKACERARKSGINVTTAIALVQRGTAARTALEEAGYTFIAILTIETPGDKRTPATVPAQESTGQAAQAEGESRKKTIATWLGWTGAYLLITALTAAVAYATDPENFGASPTGGLIAMHILMLALMGPGVISDILNNRASNKAKEKK